MTDQQPLLAPSEHGDLNWCAVLAHHAARTPDKPLCRMGDEVVS